MLIYKSFVFVFSSLLTFSVVAKNEYTYSPFFLRHINSDKTAANPNCPKKFFVLVKESGDTEGEERARIIQNSVINKSIGEYGGGERYDGIPLNLSSSLPTSVQLSYRRANKVLNEDLTEKGDNPLTLSLAVQGVYRNILRPRNNNPLTSAEKKTMGERLKCIDQNVMAAVNDPKGRVTSGDIFSSCNLEDANVSEQSLKGYLLSTKGKSGSSKLLSVNTSDGEPCETKL